MAAMQNNILLFYFEKNERNRAQPNSASVSIKGHGRLITSKVLQGFQTVCERGESEKCCWICDKM